MKKLKNDYSDSKKRLQGLITVILISLFTLTGCSHEYQSERYLYRATKLGKNILINPEAIPLQEFNRAVKAYREVFERYPDTWSASRAMVALGSLYLAKGQNDRARKIFKNVLKAYPDKKKICMEVQFAIGRSYESEDKWDKALLVYKKLIRDYLDSGIGLNLPMYIAEHYETQGDLREEDRAYRGAVVYYKKVAQKNPGTILGFRVENLIVMCYLRQENWQKAINSLKKLVMHYPNAKNVGLSMKMIADISVKRLRRPGEAVEFFKVFLARFPDHPIRGNIEKGLEVLKDVSSKKS